jgi:epoxyqueuosine reductase
VSRDHVDPNACDDLKRQALAWGASLVGFADLEGAAPPSLSQWRWAISLAVALDRAALATVRDGPTAEYYREYQRANRVLNEIAGRVASSISALGHRAEPFPSTLPEGADGDDWTRTLSVAFQHKTAATRSGLGWVGKNALLVTPAFGPRVRLATVLTEMPLPSGHAETVGHCGECRACARSCPAGAIKGTPWEAGLPREELVDAHRCWETATRLAAERVGAANAVCGVCVKVCPIGDT